MREKGQRSEKRTGLCESGGHRTRPAEQHDARNGKGTGAAKELKARDFCTVHIFWVDD